ncbi:MAG TPA: nucleotidyltransferase substrate binding protein [Catalimonadaceae bacterium]|nr:nucleotidyltransferase substrate binding protein [Catalimonadaceae bacterium]
MEQDIRWEQRFSNYRKALAKLEEGIKTLQLEELNELEKEGLIQRFEYTYELAWKTLQDLLKFKGYQDIAGPNPTLQQAFQDGYIQDGNVWKNMKKSRDLSTHTYDEETAENIYESIRNWYFDAFKALEKKLENERRGKQGELFSA